MGTIFPIDIVAPGSRGLNTENANTLLSPAWATTALNAVINQSGRIGSRKGWASQTTVAIAATPTVDTIFEYQTEAGVRDIISTAGNKIYKTLGDMTDAGNDITSTTAPTADHWKFIEFNGYALGFQTGHAPVQRTSGDFADISIDSTGQPATPDPGNDALAAFGRVWFVDEDLQTIWYTQLLDHTDMTTANGAGFIDMSSVWTNGMDRVVAIQAIGSNLVVFGQNHIVLWGDGSGSEIGIDPTQIEIVDVVEGTGCIARDSCQLTGEGDLIFLSRHGLQSLGRVIESKSNPTVDLTRNVRGDFQTLVNNHRASDAQFDQVRSCYSPEEGLYIINFPVVDQQYVLDMKHPFTDDEGRQVFPVTTWQLGGSIAGLCCTRAAGIYFGSAGIIGKYSLEQDNSAAYSFEFWTGWLDFGDPQINHRIKMMKEIIASVSIGDGTIAWNWEFDFSGTTLTRSVAYQGGLQAEFGIAEFTEGVGETGEGYIVGGDSSSGTPEFSGSVVLSRSLIAAHGEGQFLKLGCTSSINGFALILQHMSLAPKIGRMVT